MKSQAHTRLIELQARRREETRSRVLTAMQTIDEEVEASGVYRQNDGKLNLAEVSRRAGVGVTTLRNSHHHETRSLVREWLTKYNATEPGPAVTSDSLPHRKISWYEQSLKKMNAEAVKWRVEIEQLRLENEELKRQVRGVGNQAKGRVVGIRSRKDV